jgi:hypothetical protein
MRNRFSFLLGLIALIAVAMPSGAHAGTPVPQEFDCGKGGFLVGFQGHMGAWIDQIQPVCAPWDAANNRLGPVSAGDNFGNVNGGNPTLTRAICAPGYAVSRIDYGMTFPDGPPGHVQNLDVTCAMVQNLNAVDSWHPQMLSDNGNRDTGRWCATPGTIANSMVIGLDGVNITDIHHYCDTPANIIAAAPQAQGAPPSGQAAAPPNSHRPFAKFAEAAIGNQSSVPGDLLVEGTWQTDQGTMTFSQNKSTVTGTYPAGTVSGVLNNGVLDGNWVQAKADQKCPPAPGQGRFYGLFSFTFSNQNRHFDGRWTYCNTSITSGYWKGDRIK